jgi:hypothetical protein
MAYNPTNDATAGFISHEAAALLKLLATKHKRSKRGQLESLIEEAARMEEITLAKDTR